QQPQVAFAGGGDAARFPASESAAQARPGAVLLTILRLPRRLGSRSLQARGSSNHAFSYTTPLWPRYWLHDSPPMQKGPRLSAVRWWSMLDGIAGVDVADAAIGQHALDHAVDLLPQRLVRAPHANGDVP